MADRILIVDDEESIRGILSDVFHDEGYEAVDAESAEAALALLTAARFDLLFVDKNLPGMSGVDLIRRVRVNDEETSIVMMTGYASEESIIETIALGIDSYIEKPFPSIVELPALAKAILEAKRRLKPPAPRAVRVLVSISGSIDRARIMHAITAPLRGKKSVPVELHFSDTHAEALDDAAEKRVDVIIVDGNAWREKTPEAVRELKEAWPSGRCVVISAGNLSTAALRTLVELDVIAVIDWTDPRWAEKLQDAVRKRRPAA